MAAISKRLLVIAFCSLGLLLSQGPDCHSAVFYEDFESGTWPANNVEQTTTQQIGNFYYGWYGGGSGGTWSRNTTQAHNGSRSLRMTLPANSTSAPVPRIKYVTQAFSEGTAGGWFYLDPSLDPGGWLKFLDLRFDPISDTFPNYNEGECIYLWKHNTDNETHLTFVLCDGASYPIGSAKTTRWQRLHLSHSNGQYIDVTRGAWHHLKIYWKCTGDSNTGSLKIWYDGSLVYLSYGAYQNDEGEGSTVLANITDFNWLANEVQIVNWLLNGAVPAGPSQYIYWDEIFISDDFQAPNPPAGVQTP